MQSSRENKNRAWFEFSVRCHCVLSWSCVFSTACNSYLSQICCTGWRFGTLLCNCTHLLWVRCVNLRLACWRVLWWTLKQNRAADEPELIILSIHRLQHVVFLSALSWFEALRKIRDRARWAVFQPRYPRIPGIFCSEMCCTQYMYRTTNWTRCCVLLPPMRLWTVAIIAM